MPTTSRNAIRYNAAGLFVTDKSKENPEQEDLHFLNRVQAVDFSVSLSRENIESMGAQNFLGRKINAEPQVELSFEYLMTDGYEDNLLGLNVYPKNIEYEDYYGTITSKEDFSKRGNIHNNLKENRDCYFAVGQEEFDIISDLTDEDGFGGYSVVGFGNCFLTNYSISAGVGALARASVQMVASNIVYSCNDDFQLIDKFAEISKVSRQTALEDLILLESEDKIKLQREQIVERYLDAIESPSLDLASGGTVKKDMGLYFNPIVYNSAVGAINPGGITLKINNVEQGGPIFQMDKKTRCFEPKVAIQSFDVSIPFERESFYGMGNIHAFGRKLKNPQLGTISIEMLASTFKSGRLDKIACNDVDYEIEIELSNSCQLSCLQAGVKDKYLKLNIPGAKLDSYNYNFSIGDNGMVNCEFSFPVSPGSAPTISGSYTNTRETVCGPTELMAPRDLNVQNVTPFKDANAVKNIKATRV
jgi:hypothetical protein